LDFLVFLWPNRDFSMGYAESKQKNLVPCHTVAKMSQTRFVSSFFRRPELRDAQAGELKFITLISGLRNKWRGALSVADDMSGLGSARTVR
jgi:hypothetical protein